MTNSRFGTIIGLTVFGDSTNRPAIGIAVGRGDNGSAEKIELQRCWTRGAFEYAGMYNGASEGMYARQCDFANNFEYPGHRIYGAAFDSMAWLRYNPPQTPTAVTTTDPMVITRANHGLITGVDKVFVIETDVAAVDRKWTITKVDDDNFSIPVSGAGVALPFRYFKQKVWQ